MRGWDSWIYNLIAILAYVSGIVALWNLLSLYLNTNLVWPKEGDHSVRNQLIALFVSLLICAFCFYVAF